MREVRLEQWGPRLVFSPTGQLQMLRTGADGCAEHNDPAEYLLPKLCPGAPSSEIMAVNPITQGHLLEYAGLPHNSASQPEAVMGYNGPPGPWFNGTESKPIDHRYVLSSLTEFQGDVASAVAWGNFAIRVRGAANVEALAEFHAAVLAGNAALVTGARYKGNPHGVALINMKTLSIEELAALKSDVQGFLRSRLAANKA